MNKIKKWELKNDEKEERHAAEMAELIKDRN